MRKLFALSMVVLLALTFAFVALHCGKEQTESPRGESEAGHGY